MNYKFQIKNLSLLLSGSFLSQLLLIIFIPFIAEKYTQESFSYLSFIMALSSSFIPILTGNLGYVLLKEVEDKKSNEIFNYSIFYIFLTNIIFITILYPIISLIGFDIDDEFFYLLFLLSLGSSLLQVVNRKLNRLEKYASISIFKFLQSLFIIVGYFLLIDNYSGLVIANIFAIYLLLSIYLLFFETPNFFIIKNFNFKELSNYKDYLLNNSISSTLNSLVFNLPVFFISATFGFKILGYYQLYNMIIKIPFSMIAQNLSQLNMGNIVRLKKEKSKISNYFKNISLIIAVLGLLLFLSVYAFNEFLFDYFFNENKWSITKTIIKTLLLFNVIQFISSSLSTSIETLGEVRRSTRWKLINFLMMIILHIYEYYLFLNDGLIFEQYLSDLLIVGSISYIYYYFEIYSSVKHYDYQMVQKDCNI